MQNQGPPVLEPRVIQYLGQYRNIRDLRQQRAQLQQQQFKQERKQKAIQAKDKVKDLKANFVQERAQQIGAITQGITRDIQEQTERDDQIHRKRLIGETTDKNYVNDVEVPVKALLKEVQEALDKSAVDAANRDGLLKKIDATIEALGVPLMHYGSDAVEAKRKGVKDTDSVQVQRLAKIAAIKQRRADLEQLKAKLKSIRDEQAAYAYELAQDAYKGIADEDDDTAKAELVKSFQTALGNSAPAARRDFFSKIHDQDEAKLLLGGIPTEALTDFVAVHGDDGPFMRSLSESMLDDALQEQGQQDRGTYLRSNVTAVSLTSRYHRATPEGKNYLGGTVSGSMQRAKLDQRDNVIDKDTANPKSDKYLGPTEVERRATFQKRLARQAVNEITQTEVPDDVARFCAKLADDYLTKFPNDFDGARRLVGGHVMLRLVCPEMNDLAVKGGLTPEQQNTVTMQTKLLQNISNNFDPSGKEAYMGAFSDLIKKPQSQGGGPSDEVVQMQNYFDSVVIKGRNLLNPPPQRQRSGVQSN